MERRAAAAVLALLALAAGCSDSGRRDLRDAADRPELAGATTTVTTDIASPTSAIAGAMPPPPMSGTAYVPQPERRFITIGTNDRRQFTEGEYQSLAANYDVVVFARFHGGGDIILHHEATRRLKELNPAISVFAYMSTKYWFDGAEWDDAVFDPAWYLRDEDGELVPVTRESRDPESQVLGYHVDVSQPGYRAWLLDVARTWLARAPYDGIRFDSADHIGDFNDYEIKKWNRLLTPDRIEAYNDGIDTLLSSFSDALAPKTVLFNGISPSPIRGPDRDLFMLDFTAGAMDEAFCVTSEGEFHDIVADIGIMERHADKILQLRAPYPNHDVAPADLARIKRFCVVAFLLGWQPGSTHFNMGRGYSVEQLVQQPREIDLNLGAPTGAATQSNGLLGRQFANGLVYLNLGPDAVRVDLPERVIRMDAGAEQGTYSATFTVEPADAVLFLYERYLRPG